MPQRMKLVLKIVVGLVAIGVLSVLFVRSILSTRAEPYQVERALLEDWRLMADDAADPGRPVLVLQASDALGRSLFRQVFTRSMESMVAPAASAIPLVLREELAALGGVDLDALVTVGSEIGLERLAAEPVCLAHRRISEPGFVRQVYFVVFAPEPFVRAREAWRRRAQSGVGFEPDALAPVMFVAGSDAAFHRWLPMRDPEAHCVAPIEVL